MEQTTGKPGGPGELADTVPAGGLRLLLLLNMAWEMGLLLRLLRGFPIPGLLETAEFFLFSF